MVEYIDRDEALNAIERSYWTEGAYERVERLPAADVAPVVHGRWVLNILPHGAELKCNQCGYVAPYELDVHKYCPNCGAKMDAEGGEALESVEQGPCGPCAYGPPSSLDGKPCTMCPAAKKEEGHG